MVALTLGQKVVHKIHVYIWLYIHSYELERKWRSGFCNFKIIFLFRCYFYCWVYETALQYTVCSTSFRLFSSLPSPLWPRPSLDQRREGSPWPAVRNRDRWQAVAFRTLLGLHKHVYVLIYFNFSRFSRYFNCLRSYLRPWDRLALMELRPAWTFEGRTRSAPPRSLHQDQVRHLQMEQPVLVPFEIDLVLQVQVQTVFIPRGCSFQVLDATLLYLHPLVHHHLWMVEQHHFHHPKLNI